MTDRMNPTTDDDLRKWQEGRRQVVLALEQEPLDPPEEILSLSDPSHLIEEDIEDDGHEMSYVLPYPPPVSAPAEPPRKPTNHTRKILQKPGKREPNEPNSAQLVLSTEVPGFGPFDPMPLQVRHVVARLGSKQFDYAGLPLNERNRQLRLPDPLQGKSSPVSDVQEPEITNFATTPDNVPILTKSVILGVNPPCVQLFWDACHRNQDDFEPYIDGNYGGYSHSRKNDRVQITGPVAVPLELRNAFAPKEAINAWVQTNVGPYLRYLDEMTWDIVALAIIAFSERTTADRYDIEFPLLISDYFSWRGIQSKHRSPDMIRAIRDRILLLSDRELIKVYSQVDLHLTHPESGRKTKESVITEGPLFDGGKPFWRGGQIPLSTDEADELANQVPDGYFIRLGSWAQKFVAEQAMLGVYVRQLHQYDMAREPWEKQIGYYTVFQLSNQASYMRWRSVNGKRTLWAQQPLFLKSILDNSHVNYEQMAKTNPGKVINQFVVAIDRLQSDGIIQLQRVHDDFTVKSRVDPANLYLPNDGSDLPMRGRLNKLLKARYWPLPGPNIEPHILKRNAAKAQAVAEQKRRQNKPLVS